MMLLFERAVNICPKSSLILYNLQFICNGAWTAVTWHWFGCNAVALWSHGDNNDDANGDDDNTGIFID